MVLDVVVQHKVHAAGYKAVVQRHFPEFAVVYLAKAREEDRVNGRFGRVGVFALLVAHGAVQEGAPPDQARAYVGEVAVDVVFIVPGGLVLLVKVDAGPNSRADSAIDDGQFPVVAVVDLGAANKNGGAHRQSLERCAPFMGQAAEILLEGEELGGVGRRLFSGVRVVLGEGVALELVVTVLGTEGHCQGKSR